MSMSFKSWQYRGHALALALCGVALLSACKGDRIDPQAPAAEPVAALQQLARQVADNDLIGYARASVPPADYARLQAAWSQGHSRWPLTELPLDGQLLPMLAALSQPDAPQRLQRSFDAQIAGQATGVRQAAHSMGLFGVQYLRNQSDYTDAQRAHYSQVVNALSKWAAAAPLTDKQRARTTITLLTATARTAGLSTDEQLQAAGMEPSLRRLAPFFKAFKTALASYGLSLDGALTGLRGELVSQLGNDAVVRVQYPLAGEQIDAQVRMTRRDGHWYVTRTLEDAQAVLQAAQVAQAEHDARQGADAEAAAQVKDGASAPAKP
ncbi:hypothetical protein KQ945_10155 [Bacillus subtilis subsp. subtilis]|nr:hypothetical protein [Bacillus subtilis subsp. subtilis]